MLLKRLATAGVKEKNRDMENEILKVKTVNFYMRTWSQAAD
jgi:hypothetical protein